MSALAETTSPTRQLGVGEFHTFEASGQRFAYMVPSAAVFAMDDCSVAVVELLKTRPHAPEELLAALAPRFGEQTVKDAVNELNRIRAIGDIAAKAPAPKIIPLKPMPIQTLVVNVEPVQPELQLATNTAKTRSSTPKTAASPFKRRDARGRPRCASKPGKTAHHVLRRQTLMNFKVLKSTVAYARETAKALNREVDFSLTTNATLLQPDVIDFLADERIGVTISIDGPQEIQDKFRVFANGKGSYDIAAPKIKALLARHKTRPIGARVTLTKQTLDVKRIYKHLFEDMGFWEVGFAPVTTAPQRDHALEAGPGYDHLLEQFRALAAEFSRPLQNRHHASRTSARRCRKSTWATPRPTPAAPASACSAWRPTAKCHSAIASPAPTNIASARSPTASIAQSRRRSSTSTTSPTRPTAPPAGPARSAAAAAITRRTPATAPRPSPTCTTASGFAGGRTPASRSTASWP
jgi:uncharacterized protein